MSSQPSKSALLVSQKSGPPGIEEVCNKEFELPSWPIPASWTGAEALSMEGVVLHGTSFSPPTAKISIILDAYKIRYTMTSDKPNDKTYTKIPILCIGNKQINDSWVIVQGKLIYGRGKKSKTNICVLMCTSCIFFNCTFLYFLLFFLCQFSPRFLIKKWLQMKLIWKRTIAGDWRWRLKLS